jgi:hypothetical protein
LVAGKTKAGPSLGARGVALKALKIAVTGHERVGHLSEGHSVNALFKLDHFRPPNATLTASGKKRKSCLRRCFDVLNFAADGASALERLNMPKN